MQGDQFDPIDPPHYKRTSIQPRQVCLDWFGAGGLLGHVTHYIYRGAVGHKDGNPPLQDYKKAHALLGYLIERMEENQEEGTP